MLTHAELGLLILLRFGFIKVRAPKTPQGVLQDEAASALTPCLPCRARALCQINLHLLAIADWFAFQYMTCRDGAPLLGQGWGACWTGAPLVGAALVRRVHHADRREAMVAAAARPPALGRRHAAARVCLHRQPARVRPCEGRLGLARRVQRLLNRVAAESDSVSILQPMPCLVQRLVVIHRKRAQAVALLQTVSCLWAGL